MKQYDASTQLWDKTYSECKLEDLDGIQLEVEPTFDTCLKLFSEQSSRVLDFGCGTGDIIFQCAEYGHTSYGLGIDRSHTGIEYANEMAALNHFHQLDFVVGDITYFSQMEDESFDGIILSNVLDVMPKEEAEIVVSELTRLLTNDGLMFVKLNPYETDATLKEFGLTRFQDNLYEEDGVLRVREVDTFHWHSRFERDFIIERYLEFPYPWQDGLNRLFLLRKKAR